MNHKENERLAPPGAEPTDEDLRHEAELTREELAATVAALGEKADVKARVQQTAHETTEALRERGDELAGKLRERGDELAGKLPEPVAEKVRPVVDTAARRPLIPVAVVVALIVLLRLLLRRKHRA